MLRTILFILLFTYSLTFACDLDGDGLDDLIAFENETEWKWNYIRSSDDVLVTRTSPGDTNTLPTPGKYFGGNQEYLAVIDIKEGTWLVENPPSFNPDVDFNTTNFAVQDPRSYIAGQDFNGDGVSDMAKFVGACSRLKESCLRFTTLTGNFLLNSTDGVDTLVPSGIRTASGIFGRAMSALTAIDANGDGKDDICYTLPRRLRDPRQFRAICKDVVSGDRIARTKIGKLYGAPIPIEIAGTNYLVLWKRSRGTVSIRFLNMINKNLRIVAKPQIVMDKGTSPLVGKWLAGNTEQIGFIVNGTELHIYNPLTEAITIETLPNGTPISCKNNFRSVTNSKILTTRNACRVFDCS